MLPFTVMTVMITRVQSTSGSLRSHSVAVRKDHKGRGKMC